MNNPIPLFTALGFTAAGLTAPVWAAEAYSPVPEKVSAANAGAPPSDAIVLFDGSGLAAWESVDGDRDAAWTVEGDVVTVNNGSGSIMTRRRFSDLQLHIEWSPTAVIEGEGQSRGNSGIFLHSLYEVQVLDSWNNPTYVNGQAGAVYLQHAPSVNVAKPPGEWQSYDIVFTAPVYARSGALESPAYVTVFHNGVLVLNHVEILGTSYTPEPEYTPRCTPYSQSTEQDCSGPMPITLQDHGQVVSFRNIWVREL